MFWHALNAPPRPQGLPLAVKRRFADGQVRYVFIHNDLEIDDPALDMSAKHFVSPREYGFEVRAYDQGRTAWARDFGNGTLLVVNAEGSSHVLSPKLPSRLIFLDPHGYPLQDTGFVEPERAAASNLVTVRMTVAATYDVQHEGPEAARAALLALLDGTLADAARFLDEPVKLMDHSIESSSLTTVPASISSDTDFSKLLDI